MKMKKVFCILLTLATLLAMVVLPVHADGPDTLQVLGASIRIDGTEMQGLRFVGRVSEHESLTFGDDANFGFLIIPSSAVTSTDITASTDDVKTVPAKRIMGQAAVEDIGLPYEPGYIYFSAVLLGIPQEFYGSEIIARAYAPNKTSSIVTRSVASVADGISKDATAPANQKTVANNLLAVYNEVGIDMLLNASAFSQLITYPAYTGIATDSLYSVSVTQNTTTKNLTVYNQAADYTLFAKDSTSSRGLGALDSNRRFCEFAFDWGAVTVNIRVNKKFNSYVVSPTSKGFASTYSNGVISVTLEKPEYFVVILDDDYNTALAVFADLPETDVPTKGAANVVYVDTDNSITDPSGLITYSGTNNEVITITKNYAKVYVAPGAVLKKRLVFTQKWDGNNRVSGEAGYAAKVYGRGIILDPYSDIANSDMANRPYTNTFDNASNRVNSTVHFYGYTSTIQDVKVVDSRQYNVNFSQGYCSANHVKLLSSEMSTDGFTATSDKSTEGNGGTIQNCFVYVGDNALVVQNDVGHTGYTFRNVLVGTTCAAIYPQHYANCTFEDIYVFRADDGLINVYENGVGAMTVNVNGLDALDCVKTPTLFRTNGDEGTDTKTFNLKNVVMRNTTGEAKSFTPGSSPSDKTVIYNANDNSSGYVLNFTNLYVGGNYVSGNNQTGAVLKVNSSGYAGTNPGYNVTCSFAKDDSNKPAHTSVPANKTANYTGGSNYVAGPIDTLKWTRYRSYACDVKYSGGTYTVTKATSNNTDDWGLSCNLTEFARANGTGTYNVTYRASVKTRYYIVKCAKNSNVFTNVSSNVSVSANTTKTIGVSVTDVENYNWYVIVTLELDDFGTWKPTVPDSFTVTNTNLVKA